MEPPSTGEEPAILKHKDRLQDSWVWDQRSKPSEVVLSSNLKDAYFHIDPILQSTRTVAVRGTKSFADGEHYWEIVFLQPPAGSSVMLGVGTAKAALRSKLFQFINLIGQDKESWGLSYKGTIWHNGVKKKLCEPFYEKYTRIGVLLNMYDGTITFYKNGESLGQAFHGLADCHEPLYPLVSSTAAEIELSLGMRLSRELSLQEKCFFMIKNKLKNIENNVDNLPIPNIMKEYMKTL